MRIIDATARLIRAPEVRFEAQEIGLDAFGHNIENRHLLAALDAEARTLPALALVEEDAQAVEIGPERVSVTLKDGTEIAARLAIGAEGRRSLCRTAAGIEFTSVDYPQVALTCNLSHSREHDDISTEFHTESGPFTLVPLPGRRSSLVFVTDPKEAPLLARLSARYGGHTC
jgi:2-octaprenyl-6-methoxyphenol hydroxylase